MPIVIAAFVALALGVLVVSFWAVFRTARRSVDQVRHSGSPIVAWMFIPAACLCLLVSLASASYSWRFVRTASRTTGVVVEMRETKTKNGTAVFVPTVSFQDASGVRRVVASNTFSSPPEHRVGDGVTVLYSPENPEGAEVEGFWNQWGLPTVTGILGLLSFVGGLGLLLWPAMKGRKTSR